ncbi:Uncharacterised protein [Mycobacteroides abscessus subsp. massiliense]|nr:Uncharacterised protein [Mycobacteroides abscessus subsp. massiliense]
MNSLDDVRLRQSEQIVIADEVARPVGEPYAAVSGLVGPVALDRRTHRAVDHQDPLFKSSGQRVRAVGSDIRLQIGHVHSFQSGRRP